MSGKKHAKNDAVPSELTAACIRFFDSQERLTKFLGFLIKRIHQTEGDEEWRLDALVAALGGPEKKGARSGAQAKLDKEMEEHMSLVCELIACRSVDNFLIYLSELLALVLGCYPGVLDLSKVQVDLAFVLSQPDIQTVRTLYMEKKIREMSYWSLKDLASYLRDRFKFKLFDNEAERQSATNVIEERNLLVHNQGVVDRAFKERAPRHPANIGDRIKYGPKKLLECIRLVEKLALSIDRRALAQWAQLPTVKHKLSQSL